MISGAKASTKPRRPNERSKNETPKPETATTYTSCFFFQAEDGIRDKLVTGVQTCALPIFSEIGRKNGVDVNQTEMNQIVMQAAQQYRPEDRQGFIDYVRDNPMAAAQLRAPMFEDKVVDFLFAKAEISERKVTRDVLQAEIESTEIDGGHVHGPDCDHDHGHAKPKKGGKK